MNCGPREILQPALDDDTLVQLLRQSGYDSSDDRESLLRFVQLAADVGGGRVRDATAPSTQPLAASPSRDATLRRLPAVPPAAAAASPPP